MELKHMRQYYIYYNFFTEINKMNEEVKKNMYYYLKKDVKNYLKNNNLDKYAIKKKYIDLIKLLKCLGV